MRTCSHILHRHEGDHMPFTCSLDNNWVSPCTTEMRTSIMHVLTLYKIGD